MAVAVVVVAAGAGVAQTPPAFRGGVDVVVVEATVLDRSGTVVSGLGPADFAVEIDGRPREVVAADFVRHERTGAAAGGEAIAAAAADADVTRNTAAAVGRTILIAIDYASLTSDSRHVLLTAKDWLRTLGPTDRVGVVALPRPGLTVEPTTDHARVAAALERIVPHPKPPPPYSQYYNVSGWEAVRMWEQDTFVWQEVLTRECTNNPRPNCRDEIKEMIRSMELDVPSTILPVVRSLEALAKGFGALPGPKHILFVSSGWVMSERDAAREMEPVAVAAALSDVTIHTFTTDRRPTTAERSKPPRDVMQTAMLQMSTVEVLSGMTGGRAVRLPGAATLAFESLSAGLAGYYRLGVRARPEDLDGKRHRISTRLLREGLTLANTRRVFAAAKAPAGTEGTGGLTTSGLTTPGATAAGDAKAALRAALESPTPELGVDLRAGAYVMHADSGMRDVRVAVVGDVGRAAAGRATAVAALYDLDGKPVLAMENAVDVPASGAGPVTIELVVPAALYVLRVAVRDAAGHVGSLERPVDARWKQVGAIETPGLVLFRAPLGAAAPSGLVLDVVDRREQLIAQLSLSPATDRSTPIVFEVTRPGDPAPVARRPGRIAETTAGVLVARDALPVVTLQPGRYVMTAKIGDGPATLSRGFTVAAPAGSPADAGR